MTAAFMPAASLRPSSLAGQKAWGRKVSNVATAMPLRHGVGGRKGVVGEVRMMAEPSDKTSGEGVDGWINDSAAKAEMLEKAYALSVDCFTMESAKLLNKNGEVVKGESLRGKSVALLYYAEWCPQCRDFMPYIKKFYEEQKGKVEIVFVSSDFSEEDAMASYKANHGDWLMLDYKSPLRDEYKSRHGVWAGKEAAKFANSIAGFKNRKSGVPCIMVIMLDGEVCRFLPAEQMGLECLLMWDVENVEWPVR